MGCPQGRARGRQAVGAGEALTALAIVDRQATPEPTWLLDRGDFYAKKELLQVGFLTVLTGSRSPEDYWNVAPGDRVGSQHRPARALADWITDVDQGAGRSWPA